MSISTKKPRVVFISASFLARDWRDIPKDVMDDAIFFFGSKRKWLFPKNSEEEKESRLQPTKYLNFDKEFLELVLKKEKEGLVYFLKPEHELFGDYTKVSEFFQQITDPTSGEKYGALNLDPLWWKNPANYAAARADPAPERIITNFRAGMHEYGETINLLKYSINVLPVLDPKIIK